jgi:hypothetical protein
MAYTIFFPGNCMPRTKKLAAQITGRPVWAEVSLSALSHNFHAIRKFVNPAAEKRKTPRKILCIVKGNAYGHGGPEVPIGFPRGRVETHTRGEQLAMRRVIVRCDQAPYMSWRTWPSNCFFNEMTRKAPLPPASFKRRALIGMRRVSLRCLNNGHSRPTPRMQLDSDGGI